MTHQQLTDGRMIVSHHRMKRAFRKSAATAAVFGLMAAVSGCININAPEEAIVIELNVNIQAEVVYRLAEDAGNAIEENADIF